MLQEQKNAAPNRILVYGMTDNLSGIETYLINQLHSLDKDKAYFNVFAAGAK